MSDLEILEETTEEVVEDIVETPNEENGMGNILEDLTYKVPLEIPQRINDFCVISKFTWENGGRDIQKNSGWSANPYPKDYAIIPDEMVPDIEKTRGFCDIVLNEDGTEVVEFTAREIPEFPTEEPGPTLEERVSVIEEKLADEGGADIWDEMAVAIEEGVNAV